MEQEEEGDYKLAEKRRVLQTIREIWNRNHEGIEPIYLGEMLDLRSVPNFRAIVGPEEIITVEDFSLYYVLLHHKKRTFKNTMDRSRKRRKC